MHCTVDSCSSEATHTFVWPWGTEGACCQAHLVVVQQKARTARGRFGIVNFTALNPDRPREITRDERVELHSARLVAESERDDARLRATKLLDANTELTRERNALRARSSQLEAQVKELTARVATVLLERDNALVTLDEVRASGEPFDGEELERVMRERDEAHRQVVQHVDANTRLLREVAEFREGHKRLIQEADELKAEVARVKSQLAEPPTRVE